MTKNEIDPGHEETKGALAAIGALLAIMGGIFTLIGLVSFFSAFSGSSSGPPSNFFFAFIGLPMLGIGIGLIKSSMMGKIARYEAGEIAPVAKDTINYLAEETQDGVEDIARAISHGVNGNQESEQAESDIECPKCGVHNRPEARFCHECGAGLAETITCPSCGASNEPEAKFCDSCGKAISG